MLKAVKEFRLIKRTTSRAKTLRPMAERSEAEDDRRFESAEKQHEEFANRAAHLETTKDDILASVSGKNFNQRRQPIGKGAGRGGQGGQQPGLQGGQRGSHGGNGAGRGNQDNKASAPPRAPPQGGQQRVETRRCTTAVSPAILGKIASSRTSASQADSKLGSFKNLMKMDFDNHHA